MAEAICTVRLVDDSLRVLNIMFDPCLKEKCQYNYIFYLYHHYQKNNTLQV